MQAQCSVQQNGISFGGLHEAVQSELEKNAKTSGTESNEGTYHMHAENVHKHVMFTYDICIHNL